MKVYLAGKISDPERAAWRDHLFKPSAKGAWMVKRPISFGNLAAKSLAWPSSRAGMMDGHEYVGPFLLDCWDEGEGGPFDSAEHEHQGEAHGTRGPGAHGQLDEEDAIYEQCFSAVARCDVLIAYLDGPDLHGTLIEIGWALARSKVVKVFGHWEVTREYGDLLRWASVRCDGYSADYPDVPSDHPDFIPNSLKATLQAATKDYHEIVLREMPYQEYLKTEHWMITRTNAVHRAAHRCQVCGKSGPLEVHHNNYERRGAELPSDLIALCRDCHSLFHGKLPAESNGQVIQPLPPISGPRRQ